MRNKNIIRYVTLYHLSRLIDPGKLLTTVDHPVNNNIRYNKHIYSIVV